jgi:hypothetical protein
MIEKINKKKIIMKESDYLIDMFSLLYKTVLISFPFDVSNPVLKTYPKQYYY